MFPRRPGRPSKPPSAHAFDWTPYAPIAFRLTADYLKFWRTEKRCNGRPPEWWRELHLTLIDEAVLQMSALARRYDGWGKPGLYLKKFLPRRCAAPFAQALAEALGPVEEVSFSSQARFDDAGKEIVFDPANAARLA